jgi:hypothetical protein
MGFLNKNSYLDVKAPAISRYATGGGVSMLNKNVIVVSPTPPTPPERTPVAWWKGEDDYADSIQPGLPLARSNTNLNPAFTDGIIGRCFIIDKTGAPEPYVNWDSLTIGGEGATQEKTNLSSFETWEIELYVKFDSLVGWFYLFQAYDYIGGVDFVAASIELEDDYIDVYNQGEPWLKFENLGLQAGVWYKINLIHTLAINTWQCFLNGIEKTVTGSPVMEIIPHNYTTFFAGEDRNSPVLHVDEIKIFAGEFEHPPLPPADTLLLWLKGNNNANDSSGRGNHASWLTGEGTLPAAYDTGLEGNCFKLRSPDYYGSTSGIRNMRYDCCALTPNGKFSIDVSAKYHIEGTPAENFVRLFERTYQGAIDFVLMHDVVNNKLRVATMDGYQLYSKTWNDGDWLQPRLTYDNGTWEIYEFYSGSFHKLTPDAYVPLVLSAHEDINNYQLLFGSLLLLPFMDLWIDEFKIFSGDKGSSL